MAKSVNRRQAIKTIGAAAALGGTNSQAQADSKIKNFLRNGPQPRSGKTPLKARAANDYRASLAAYGGRLSNPIQELFPAPDATPHVDIAIIGSGYGASICAARLAERLGRNQRLCVIERGREWIPGTFPDTFAGIYREGRQAVQGPKRGEVNNPLGLFNVVLSDEINVMSGSALGGTSIINASVALKPDPDVFRLPRWPAALKDRAVLDPYYEKAARDLQLTRSFYDMSPKIRTRRQAAENITRRPGFFDRSPLSVMYDHRYLDDQMQNRFGMIQRTCTMCGDCITGCNVGAKSNLCMNYLPYAKSLGAELYTQLEVISIRPCQQGYELKLHHHDNSSGKLITHCVTLTAELVILGCGSPASAQILLQSQNGQFCFSPALGQHWTANGDTIGFVMDGKFKTNISGVGAYPCKPGPGPTVQTSLAFERRPKLRERILIQEAAIPRAVINLFKYLLKDRQLDNSMVMLGMGIDDAKGEVVFHDKRWQIKWPGLKKSGFRKMMFREFERVAQAHGGWYKRLKEFGDNLVSVHPLGACCMADDPQDGVVNQLGQVYDGQQGGYLDYSGQPAIHPGLYVSDGSVVSTPLGVNPYMTIAALSERIAHHITANPAHAHLFQPASTNAGTAKTSNNRR